MTPPPGPSHEAFAVITGGGTGGHVYPALALAGELVGRGHSRDTIRFVGASRGLEARVVPERGYAIDLLPGRGFQRRLTIANLRAAWDTLVAFVRARRIIRRVRPRVVVGVGGYASLPSLIAARLRRVPSVVHEQNAAPGLANRIAVRMGAKPAVSLPGTPLRAAVLTGNPVRSEIAAVRRAPDADLPLVAVFGTQNATLYRPGGATTRAVVVITGSVNGVQNILGITAESVVAAWLDLIRSPESRGRDSVKSLTCD